MFCGQCGRAITSADVAAFRATESDVVEPTESPAWRLHEPPAAAVPAGTPWWVSAGDDATPGHDDPRQHTEGVVDPSAATEGEVDELTREAPVSTDRESAPDPGANEGESDPVAHEPASADEPVDSPAVTGVVSPVTATPQPLRPPAAGTQQARPVSAPLWTASLAPVTPETVRSESAIEAEAEAEAEAELGLAGVADDASVVDDASASDDAGATGDELSATESPASLTASPAGPSTAHEAPSAGDTNVTSPLVTPTASGTSGPLRCTFCGARLSEEDIFCGECGAVVQSVAQSFTGPIVPILTGVVPPADAPALPADALPEMPSALSETKAHTSPSTPDATPVPTSDAAPPSPKKRRRFGRRAHDESPQLWSAPPVQAASEGDAPPVASGHAPSLTSETVAPENLVPAALDRSQGKPAHETHTDANSVTENSADHRSAGDPVEFAPEPVVRASQVPHAAPMREAPLPTDAPLAPTPVDAPSQTAEPVLVPLPPAPESPQRVTPWATLGASEDDIEQTRIVARAALGESFVLQFSTGESFTVQGNGLVGRAPAPQPGEAIDLLVRIVDPGKSVSKTHLEFGQDEGSLWVSDRWSGNGSVVRQPQGQPRRCEPGKRIRVARGSRVDIGEQFFIVS